VWGKNRDDGTVHNMVSVCKDEAFPYLDIELYWSKDGKLFFRVHLKKNQQLKYLNMGSTHTKACFTAIPLGVMKRLASLMTRMVESEIFWMNELYPKHAEALRAAKLAPNMFLTLGEVPDETMSSTTDDERERVRKRRETLDASHFLLECANFGKCQSMLG